MWIKGQLSDRNIAVMITAVLFTVAQSFLLYLMFLDQHLGSHGDKII
jgi:hypothetical protein